MQNVRFDLLRLGAECEVLGPPEVRQRMVDAVVGMNRLYPEQTEKLPSTRASD